MRFHVVIILMLLSTAVIHAQEVGDTPEALPPLPEAQVVEAEAPDELMLVGDFYLLDPTHPTLLLLHELYTTRASWNSLLEPLLRSGYNVLAVDLRGHGATRGAIDWPLALEDVGVWTTWLREVAGVRPDGISMMGSSMGSTLAIVGCARDALCRTAIAISPGWAYYDISVADSIAARPMLVVYAQRDRWPALGVPHMIEAAPDTLTVVTYPGNAHGKDLLYYYGEEFTQVMLEWLAVHGN